MLLPLVAAFQLAAASVIPPLQVRVEETVRPVAAVRHPDGGVAVSLAALAEAVGGTVVRDRMGAGGRPGWRFRVDSLWVALTDGSRLVVSGADTLALPAAVFQRGDSAFVPDALATDILPRLGVGVVYDSAAREVVRIPLVGTTPPAERDDPAGRATGGRGAAEPPRSRVVVVDAGHGGADAGMTGIRVNGRLLVEKEVTLAVAHALRAALEARGVTVVMTRRSDTLVALADRGRLANEAQGALFLSLHVNAANPRWGNPGAVRGFETYFLAEARTDEQRRLEALENAAVRFEERGPSAAADGGLEFVMRDLAVNAHLRGSADLAALLDGGMRTVHPGPSRGVQQAGFRVLRSAFMPSVLVELGYGSHPGDAAFLTDPARQRVLGRALAEAAVRFLDRYAATAEAGR